MGFCERSLWVLKTDLWRAWKKTVRGYNGKVGEQLLLLICSKVAYYIFLLNLPKLLAFNFLVYYLEKAKYPWCCCCNISNTYLLRFYLELCFSMFGFEFFQTAKSIMKMVILSRSVQSKNTKQQPWPIWCLVWILSWPWLDSDTEEIWWICELSPRLVRLQEWIW